jgi:CDP-6-deoxy-D-xylo-4-hexulose-3-dehydrase
MDEFREAIVPLAMEGLGAEEINAAIKVFQSGKHTMGPEVFEFEQEFARYVGSKHAVMVNSGSSANLLALEAFVRAERAPKDFKDSYIAIPAVLWPTSLWPIIQLGLKVLIIDTLPNSLEIDFDLLERAKVEYKDKLIGAVLIHPLGKSLNLTKVNYFKSKYGMFILEDNAESLGAGQGSSYAGTVGDFGTFSFYFSHHMTTVEGGMVVTNDDVAADNLRSMRSHGWTRHRLDKAYLEDLNPNINPEFLFVTSGYNFRPMEFQGAIGKMQLRKLSNFIDVRTKNAETIIKRLVGSSFQVLGTDSSLSNITKSQGADNNLPVSNSWMAIPLLNLNPAVSTSQIHARLNANGIQSRPLLAGDFLNQPAGKHSSIKSFGPLDNSMQLYSNSIMLGNHHAYSQSQISHLCDVLNEF